MESKNTAEKYPEFQVRVLLKGPSMYRSVIFNREVLDRLEKFYNSNPQYTKKVIFNSLLSEILSMYGF